MLIKILLRLMQLKSHVRWTPQILEGRSYWLKFPWIGIVNRSQDDINKNIDMIAARRKEREYFASTPEHKHLANRMGSEHLAKMLSKSRIPGIQSLINKTVVELETELSHLGKPIAADAGEVVYYHGTCCLFDQNYKEHLDGMRPGGDKVHNVLDNQLPVALQRLQFDKQLPLKNIRKLITEADGYQPHLLAPEQGYRRLIESTFVTIRGQAEASVDAIRIIHSILKDLVHRAISETTELKQYPALRTEVENAAMESLERMREQSKKAALQLERQFYHMLMRSAQACATRFQRSLFIVKSAKLKEVYLTSTTLNWVNLRKKIFTLLNKDPAIMERRSALAKRLELYRSAQAEIDTVAWSK
ncbi:hypothetical protein V6N13_096012 [Hibiscus sabdariffa]